MPRAATVAGPEPDIAAKKHATDTITTIKPPRRCPTQLCAKLIKRSEMPAFSMTLPPRIKNGTANKTNLLVAEEKIRGNIVIIVSSGRPAPSISIPKTLETPRQIAIGVPTRRNAAKLKKITGPIISRRPPCR